MIVYGCDIGITGAIACMSGVVDGRIIDVCDIPIRIAGNGVVKKKVDGAALAAIVREWRQQLGVDSEMAVVEKLSARPSMLGRGQGSASTFSLGYSSGSVETMFLTLGIPVHPVEPAVWKRSLGLGKDKNESRGKASMLYPSQAGFWSRVKDHNRAESVLLAHYGWHKLR